MKESKEEEIDRVDEREMEGKKEEIFALGLTARVTHARLRCAIVRELGR